jgi:glycosyltransferase involved in cell wall biosynthesis
MLFSVIIPVYNVASYLMRAVDSVLQQDFPGGIEIILVDDGSIDSSAKICDEYAALHLNVKVFHTNNRGVSSARNVGLEAAAGEYIVFLDGDDWLDKDVFQTFFDVLSKQKIDVLNFSLKRVDTQGEILEKQPIWGKTNRILAMSEFLKGDFLCQEVFLRVYRTEFLQKNHLRFNEELSFCEDGEFLARVDCYAESIYLLEYWGYNYFIRPDSAMNNTQISHLQKRFGNICYALELLVGLQKNLSGKPLERDTTDANLDVLRSNYISIRINMQNYHLFIALISRPFPLGWARTIFLRLKQAKLLPLPDWRKDFAYRLYRQLTCWNMPLFVLRYINASIVTSSRFRAMFSLGSKKIRLQN